MIIFLGASLAATVPAAQPAPASPHAQHLTAKHQATDQPSEQKMDGMGSCCCCKDMDGKEAARSGAAKPADPQHSGHK